MLSDFGGNGALRQRLDVQGNSSDIASGLAVRFSAYLGGVGVSLDEATVRVRFLDEFLSPTGPAAQLGPISTVNRNEETVVMRCTDEALIPMGTAFIDVEVCFADVCCGGAFGLVDNVTARLVQPTTPEPLPLGVNIVSNGSFESGSLPGSPLELNNPDSWLGQASTVEVLSYGGGGAVPDGGFAGDNGLGGVVLSDLGGGGALRKELSLAGYEDRIQLGALTIWAQVWLGASLPLRTPHSFG